MKKEKFIKNSVDPVSLSGTSTILYQMINCVCKIRIKETHGTGFFCGIPYDNNNIMQCLMTNYHIINEKCFKENKGLNLYWNNEKGGTVLNLDIKRKSYFNKDYDIAIIELKKTDEIKNMLLLDDNLFKDETKLFFEEKSIYSIQYPHGKDVVVSYGLLNGIDNYNIKHTCSTTDGSSGSPLINLLNNKVIGIHKEGSINFNFNKGTFLKFPLNDFIENLKNNEQENNKNENDFHLKLKSSVNDLDYNNEIKLKYIDNLINESFIKENFIKRNSEALNNIKEEKDLLFNDKDNEQNKELHQDIKEPNKIEQTCIVVDKWGNK